MRALTSKVAIPALIAWLICSCSTSVAPTDVAGGSTKAGNAMVAGKILLENGQPAVNTEARLLKIEKNDLSDTSADYSFRQMHVDTTDETGLYRFDSLEFGLYALTAVQLTERSRLMINDIDANQPEIGLPDAFLASPGVIKIPLPDSISIEHESILIEPSMGYYPLSGSPLPGNHLYIDSVPTGIYRVYFGKKFLTSGMLLREWTSIEVRPGDTADVHWDPRDTARLIRYDSVKIDGELGEFSALTPIAIRDSNGIFRAGVTWSWNDSALYFALSVIDSELTTDSGGISDGPELLILLPGMLSALNPLRLRLGIVDSASGEGIRLRCRARGTVNDHGDSDTGYTLEMAIPWEYFRAHGADLTKNVFGWAFQFNVLIHDVGVRPQERIFAYLPETGGTYLRWSRLYGLRRY